MIISKDIGRCQFGCLPFPLGVEKGKTSRRLDDLDCNCMVPSEIEGTMNLAI